MAIRGAAFLIVFSLSLSPSSAYAQSAVLVHSPCAYCPGCFSFCPGDGGQYPALPECPVCEPDAVPVALPRTGQTACYTTNGNVTDCAGTGQDGHIQAGVAWPVPRFNDNLDGTMTDGVTGLTWLKDANCIATQYPAFDNDGLYSGVGDGQVTWQHALDFVNAINDGDYSQCDAGRHDWRLPNINEIDSLFNAGEGVPREWLSGQGFQNVLSNYYWSSTTYAPATHIAWVLDMYSGNGTRSIAGKSSSTLYPVWPVRGTTGTPARVPKTGQVNCYSSDAPWDEIPCAATGQDGEIQAGASWPAPRFIENGDGTITDNLAGLMWLKDANCLPRSTWQASLDAVSTLNADPSTYDCSGYTAEYTDWRLPNINELESLLNEGTSNLAAWLLGNGYLFHDVQPYYYWSSTSRVEALSSAVWAFDMIDGEVDPGSKNFVGPYVWPVRDAPPKFLLTIELRGAGSGTVATVAHAGIDCGTDCIEPYEDGASVTLEAVPAAGSEFAGWGGDPGCESGVVLMDTNRTCTATFDLDMHTITVIKNGTGGGTVLIGGPGGPLACGQNCQASYPAGIGVLLDVIPDADSDFAGWSGDSGCENANAPNASVLLDTDKACVATFNLKSYRLIVAKAGNGSGTVVSANMFGIDCGQDCSEAYPVGTQVMLQASADAGSIFAGWGGEAECDDGVIPIGSADIVCVAVFTIQTYTLTVTKDGLGKGAVGTNEPGGMYCGVDCASADKTYDSGVEVTLIAGTEPPWIFAGWSGDPGCSQGSVTMDADKTCIATFCVGDVESGCAMLGDCGSSRDGVLDLFDVLRQIDVVLQRVLPTAVDAVVCDADCGGSIDVFDVLLGIDVILRRIAQPLACPGALGGARIRAEGELAVAADGAGMPAQRTRVVLRERGRAVVLGNRSTLVRGIELTLTPEGGPVQVAGVRATHRTRGFLVGYHQSGPTTPVKVLVVSLAGQTIPPGDGAIARLKVGRGSGRGHLRLTDVQVAQ